MIVLLPPYRVSLVIPVYNEAQNIVRVIAEVFALPVDPTYSLEVIVVDGGSSDGSQAVAQEAGAQVVLQRQRGYGAACYNGYEAADKADILVFLDGDYSDPPAAIPAMLNTLLTQKADLVLGSRTLGQTERGALLRHQIWGNRLVTTLIRVLYGRQLSDLPSLKAIWRERLTSFDMQEMTYGFTVEMLVKAARSGCNITEIPIDYRRRGSGHSKVSGTLEGTVKSAYHLINTSLRYRLWRQRPLVEADLPNPSKSR